MKVYIAAPYTQGDVAVNVRNAILAAEALVAMGHDPFIPHLTHLWHLVSPHTHAFWLERDKVWLSCCDALLRLPGPSTGADTEVEWMQADGKPVYYDIGHIPEGTNA